MGRALAPILLALDLLTDANATVTSEGLKKVSFYVMGAVNDTQGLYPGNYWTTMDDWPVYTPTPLYLAPLGAENTVIAQAAGATEVKREHDHSIRFQAPQAADASVAPLADATGSDALTSSRLGALSHQPPASQTHFNYRYDPADPVPTLGGNNLFESCGPLDQAGLEATSRGDVLSFTSPKLAAPLAITGPVVATLYVASNCTDTDFTVKLTDVSPDGKSTLLLDGIVRMRWREGPTRQTQPIPIIPGQVYAVNVSLWHTSFIWAANHSVRVDVSSSNYPRFSVNPNNGLPVNANGSAFVANNTVLAGGATPSAIILPVVDAATQLPAIPLLEQMRANVAGAASANPQAGAALQSLLGVAPAHAPIAAGGRLRRGAHKAVASLSSEFNALFASHAGSGDGSASVPVPVPTIFEVALSREWRR